jgi:hypothetical protein
MDFLKNMEYNDITFDMLGTHRQRPMYLSKFTKFRQDMNMREYPKDPHAYTEYFIQEMDKWINSHEKIKYYGLETFNRKDTILGTTHQLDELHMLYGNRIVTYVGEYRYHRRLTGDTVRQIRTYTEIQPGDVLVLSYPSCITTGTIDEFQPLLAHCELLGVPIHIDGAWFGQCRNFFVDVSHPSIKSVSVSLSKAFGMGSQRIGIRYSKVKTNGPISIMNDYCYANVSDMWIGVEMLKYFGTDYWWKNYEGLYSKVCTDFGLQESNSIHVGWNAKPEKPIALGVRTPLRFLIEGVFDQRGTDNGLNAIELSERKVNG